jgi:ubiquinone/menaquinone biosynthesis C-methylase UbiE
MERACYTSGVRVASEKRFSETVDDYDKHRPSYPAEAIDWILATSGAVRGARVVDLGCGTGIVTRLFAARGLDVVGVDPNEDMLARARSRAGGTRGAGRFVKAEASATGLEPASFDLAVAGQAFHWFDVRATTAEIARIVKPGGWSAAFWNVRTSTPTMDAYEALLRAWSPEYATLRSPERTLHDLRAVVGASVREASFANGQTFDWTGFRGRVFSSSYVVHGVDRKDAFEQALRALFDERSPRGVIEFAYVTTICAWPVA